MRSTLYYSLFCDKKLKFFLNLISGVCTSLESHKGNILAILLVFNTENPKLMEKASVRGRVHLLKKNQCGLSVVGRIIILKK